MAEYRIMYWQEIPSVVQTRDGKDKAKRELSQKFQELIDMAAMRRGLEGSDEYLTSWKRGDWETREGTAEEVVAAVEVEIEAQYDAFRQAVIASTS